MKRRIFLVTAFCSAMLMAGHPAVAEPLPAPDGEVVLTVSGEIAQANTPEGVQFDFEMLKAFPTLEIETTTDWHDGVQKFRGASAIAVLEAAGLKGATLTASAADDYSIEMTLDELKSFDPIFALEWNGNDMREEAEGPVWLVFAYDRMTPEQRERYTALSVWELQRIKVQN